MALFDRILELHKILSARRLPVSGPQLQEELRCKAATVKRRVAISAA